MWKVGQQAGRAGRDVGSKAACVTVHWPGQKGTGLDSFSSLFNISLRAGKSTPAARVRTVFNNREECLRDRLNSAFKLSDTHGGQSLYPAVLTSLPQTSMTPTLWRPRCALSWTAPPPWPAAAWTACAARCARLGVTVWEPPRTRTLPCRGCSGPTTATPTS